MALYQFILKALEAVLQLPKRPGIAAGLATDMAKYMTPKQMREVAEILNHLADEKEASKP